MTSFRCLEDRHIAGEIDLMQWNPKMDLIALSLTSGDMILHRLVSWQKVWHIPAHRLKSDAQKSDDNKSKRCKVVDFDWRPDGKILAIAYDHVIDCNQHSDDTQSCVALHDVESSELIHTIVVEGRISCVCWQEKKRDIKEQKNIDENSLDFNFSPLSQSSCSFSPFINMIPKIEGFSKNFAKSGQRKLNDENMNDLMKVNGQNSLNVLAIGTDDGIVELYALGAFKIARISVGSESPISYLALSNDLGLINVLVKSSCSENNTQYSMLYYSLQVLKQRSDEILLIAQVYAQSISLLFYFNETIREILEAWEDVMVEIDSKLSNYVSHHRSQKGEDAKDNKIPLMAEEFLELLALGTASDSLEKFLTELTDKGLKKLGHSVELAYSNIQKLVVKNIQRLCQHLYCHFNTLKGMSLWEAQFGDVGLDVNSVNKTLKSIGSFLLKSTELQQVIDISMKNVKAFIRWLYTSMIRLNNNEPSTQSELTKVSQQDIQFVTEFIKENFEFETPSNVNQSSPRPSASNFTLERVGQYLRDKDLTCINSSIHDMSINPWFQFLKDRPQLIANDDDSVLYLYSHNPKTSFIQEHKMCDKSVREAFHGPFNLITKSIEENGLKRKLVNIICVTNNGNVKICHITNSTLGFVYYALIKDYKHANQLHIIRSSIRDPQLGIIEMVSLSFLEPNKYSSESFLKIADFQFYTEDIISLLLIGQESNVSYLVQLPMNVFNDEFKDISLSSETVMIDFCGNVSSETVINYRILDNMKSSVLAVSGSRKVACVAFASKRRVRLFEMDVCEDEEEENEKTQVSISDQSAMESERID